MSSSEAICPSHKEVSGWKVSTALVHVLLTIILAVSAAQYRSSSSIADALHAIQVTFAKHLGEHEGLVDRVDRLEAQVIIYNNGR